MQQSQLVEIDDQEQWGTSPTKDPMFLKVDELLEDCIRAEDCRVCPVYRKCLSIHTRVSSLSASGKLTYTKMDIYLGKLQKFVKSKKAEPICVFFIAGVIICGGYYGVPLHLSLLRQ